MAGEPKTDVKDAEWIADLLQHGLLKASFIPSVPQRVLRDLTRYRVRLTEEHIWPHGRLFGVAPNLEGRSSLPFQEMLKSGRISSESQVYLEFRHTFPDRLR